MRERKGLATFTACDGGDEQEEVSVNLSEFHRRIVVMTERGGLLLLQHIVKVRISKMRNENIQKRK